MRIRFPALLPILCLVLGMLGGGNGERFARHDFQYHGDGGDGWYTTTFCKNESS